MKQVNLYMVFTNKMIKLNEKKNIFHTKNNCFLSLKSVRNKGATIVFNYIPDYKI